LIGEECRTWCRCSTPSRPRGIGRHAGIDHLAFRAGLCELELLMGTL
jgi:hypothetical protein